MTVGSDAADVAGLRDETSARGSVGVGVAVGALSILLWVRHSHRMLSATDIDPLSPTPGTPGSD